MTSHDRDQAIEHALRGVLRAPSSQPVAPCPDAEVVAAWADHALTKTEAASVEEHLSLCTDCQALVAAFGRSTPRPNPTPSVWQRWRLAWLVPVATATTAVAIWVALPSTSPRAIEPLSTIQPDASRPAGPAENQEATPAPSAPAAAAPVALGRAAEFDAAPSSLAKAEQAVGAAERFEAPQLQDRARADNPPQAPPPAARASTPLEERVAAPASVADSAAGAPLRQAVRGALSLAAAGDVVSPDPMLRWRITQTGSIERSTTGGSIWVAATVDRPAALLAGNSPDPRTCWMVGRGGAIRLTTDGVQFRVVPFPEAVDLVGVRATSARAVDVTTADGRLFRTEDQGATWMLVPR